jgi:hypothetical protein
MKKKIKVKGTLKHDFDVLHVLKLIEDGKLSHDDAIEVLVNACGVITGLRATVKILCDSVCFVELTKHEALSNQWMKGD